MKALTLLFLLAALAIAQVPTDSTVGNLTIHVEDASIPVPYGPAEMHAVITVCSPVQASYVEVDGAYQGGGLAFNLSTSVSVKAASGYCSIVMAPVATAIITEIDVNVSQQGSILAKTATAGSTATSQDVKARRRR
jgi:hypothetical protein